MKRVYSVATSLTMLLAPAVVSPGLAAADQRSWPTGYGQQHIEMVVQRALSQRGVPFVYGGGNASGPTTGVRQSASTAPGTTGLPGTSGLPGTAALPGTTLPGTATLPGAGVGTVPGNTATLPGAGVGTVPGTGTLPGGTTPGTVGFDASGLIQYAFAGVGLKLPRRSNEQCSVGRKVPPAQARRGDLICYGPGGSQSVALFLGNGQMIEGTEPAVTVSAARTTNMAPYVTRIIDS